MTLAAEPLLGAHMSIAGGLHRAVERAVALGCTALQIFTRNASQWQAKPLAEAEVARFRAAWRDSGIGPIAVHDSYLINLASPDPALRQRSIRAFGEELDRCHRLGTGALVMHPGAHLGTGVEAGLERLCDSFRHIAATAPPAVEILLENTAGQGTGLGADFAQLGEVMARVPELQFGLCLDTCHAFAAGYDLSGEAGYAALMAEIDRCLGLDRLRLIHVNDSKKPLGSRVDRHEHPGRGAIGLAAFRRLMRDPRLGAVPKILETPKGEDDVWDRRNLRLLRRLARSG